MIIRRTLVFILVFISFFSVSAFAQHTDLINIDYNSPKKYEIGEVKVTGANSLDHSTLISLSGLKVGTFVEIPGDQIRNAIDKLWQQNLFEDIQVNLTQVSGNKVSLEIEVIEKPRLGDYTIVGIRKGDRENLEEKVKINRGDVVTSSFLVQLETNIKNYYKTKGFYNTTVNFAQKNDTKNEKSVILTIHINKGKRTRIEHINIIGNEKVSDYALKGAMKKTKERGVYKPLKAIQNIVFDPYIFKHKFTWDGYRNNVRDIAAENLKLRIFKSSKFIDKEYEEDKVNLVKEFYNQGYRDAMIIDDSVYHAANKNINIDLKVKEGKKYYFRNISFVGNTRYTPEQLSSLIGIRKGDVYSQEKLEKAINQNPNGTDLYTLFLDDGYLIAQIVPVETAIVNDSIDIEIRINEGKQMKLNKVIAQGNSTTNDKVIVREFDSRPGYLFRKTGIMRTQMSLRNLKYFDETKFEVETPNLDPSNGTVDIVYKLAEKSTAQFELSGGWGYNRFMGTVGISFDNFSMGNLFNKKAWRPVPSGDGEKLSLRVQSYGSGYISLSASYVKPWLGDKRPNDLSVSTYLSKFKTSSTSTFSIFGASVGYSQRLKWPDNYFSLNHVLSAQIYDLKGYQTSFNPQGATGKFQNYSYTIGLTRYSVDAPIFSRYGSEFRLSWEGTLPYSLLNPNKYENRTGDGRYKMIEFYQVKFLGTVYKQIYGDLVMMLRTKMGFIGAYNSNMGPTPFNRYYMGGSGMSGSAAGMVDGRQIIGFRGYTDFSMIPNPNNQNIGATVYNKHTFELRYPLSNNPNATIYGLVFLEAGNSWERFKDVRPFDLKKSAGIGARIMLPMFGLIGLDWGYGFDKIPGLPDANKGQFHFSMNSSID